MDSVLKDSSEQDTVQLIRAAPFSFVYAAFVGLLRVSSALFRISSIAVMLKLNGQRAESGEIEAAVRIVPSVTNAAVKCFEKQSGKLLCAYYTADTPVSAETVKTVLKRRLPDYTYLKMCAENNKRPKFYKLLVNNGDGSYSLQPDGSTDG